MLINQLVTCIHLLQCRATNKMTNKDAYSLQCQTKFVSEVDFDFTQFLEEITSTISAATTDSVSLHCISSISEHITWHGIVEDAFLNYYVLY